MAELYNQYAQDTAAGGRAALPSDNEETSLLTSTTKSPEERGLQAAKKFAHWWVLRHRVQQLQIQRGVESLKDRLKDGDSVYQELLQCSAEHVSASTMLLNGYFARLNGYFEEWKGTDKDPKGWAFEEFCSVKASTQLMLKARTAIAASFADAIKVGADLSPCFSMVLDCLVHIRRFLHAGHIPQRLVEGEIKHDDAAGKELRTVILSVKQEVQASLASLMFEPLQV